MRRVEEQEAATATPTFVWRIPNTPNGRCSGVAAQNRDCLHVDPPTGQFRYFSTNPSHTPVAATVRDMGVTQQRVWWSWHDNNSTVFVWGSVDRVRKSVRMTMLQRTSTTTTRSTRSREGTP
ncbi:MAG: hypothetical protein FJ033_08370 [Chloroflexi bacterium]|nr:hypothetical protein [Chloroflexota bacterium]